MRLNGKMTSSEYDALSTNWDAKTLTAHGLTIVACRSFAKQYWVILKLCDTKQAYWRLSSSNRAGVIAFISNREGKALHIRYNTTDNSFVEIF